MNDGVDYRDIPGFPGYRVGSDGSVWSGWITCRKGRIFKGKWKRMKPAATKKGYHTVNITPPDSPYKTMRVHRLVLLAFVGPCPPGMECRHLNGDKADCRLSNLEWGTPQTNRGDNHTMEVYQRGSQHSQAVLTEADVVAIRKAKEAGTATVAELARRYGVSWSNVYAIVTRRSWKHV